MIKLKKRLIKIMSTHKNIEFESKPIPITDNAGREIFWEDLGRPNGE